MQEEDDSDEEVVFENFFFFFEKVELFGVELYFYFIFIVFEELFLGMELELVFQDDVVNVFFEFKMVVGLSGVFWMFKFGDDYSYNQFFIYGDVNVVGVYYQDYYSGGYYFVQDLVLVFFQEIVLDVFFIDDEVFKWLQGKRN